MRGILEHTFDVNRSKMVDKDTVGWYCSLRSEEYDHEHDGIVTKIKDSKHKISNLKRDKSEFAIR